MALKAALLSSTIIIALLLNYGTSDSCIPRYFNQNSFVCVCNVLMCPPIEATTPTAPGYIDSWESSRDKYRFHKIRLRINGSTLSEAMMFSTVQKKIQITLIPSETRQTIIGFGGAFTDAAGYNLASLPMVLRERILQDYFSSNGLSYSVARVPIAGTDFSLRPYTYNDDHDGDFNLDYFSLQPEDLKLKIPMIKRAQSLTNGKLKTIASAWSAPAWMKTDQNISGSGFLIGSPGGPYYKTWAKYYVKFLKAYASYGINFWGITTQNEPTQPIVNEEFFYNSLGFSPSYLAEFVKLDLGPALQDAGYGTDELNVLLLDDIREFLPNYTRAVLRDPEAARYITGIGFHWYSGKDGEKHYENLNRAHDEFGSHFLFSTEACEGYERFSTRRAQLGNWTRAETIASDIMEDLNRYTTGWLDWNLVLNTQGGPSWVENWTDGLILVDASKAVYYINPMFYALGHFSKFIPPGSVYIAHELNAVANGINLVSFIDPSNQIVVVLLNTNDYPVDLVINEFTSVPVPIALAAHSIRTLITPRVTN